MDRILSLLVHVLTFFARFKKFFAKHGIGEYEEWQPGQKLKILLVGYNGARNTGSDVRVASIARQVADLLGKDNVEISVTTLDAYNLKGYFHKDVRMYTLPSLFPLHIFHACSIHHAAIICEGSTLKSTFANALTLFMCEAAGIMAAQGKPCIAFGSEVGAMEPFLRRAASRLCKDTYFITRTEGSLVELEKLGLKGHAGTDAAWLYEGAIENDEAQTYLREQGWDGEKPLLGIAVIDPFCWPVRSSFIKWFRGHINGNMQGQYDLWYFFSESDERKQAFEKYVAEIARGVKDFIGEKDCFPVIMGMERLDEKACRNLREKLDVSSAMFLSGEYSADIMTGILRQFDMLVTSRYHGAVLSMEHGCPVIAVSMDERLSRLMGDLSMDDKYLFGTADEELGRGIAAALESAWAERDDIHERIETKVAEYKRELTGMGEFMREYLEDHLNL
ncbi:MAG: polysaccharide pyruvyl transferase family protein [Firmicutes bacterium]|nr:polysaccharide pyruvyl transferase family protein [Bacillota bacterium]